MIITELVEISSGRYKVYIDQEFAFVLYKGELRLYNITVGRQVKEADYEEIIGTVLPKRARLRAMNLLQKKSYTEKQLTDKLKEGLYPAEIVEEAIAYVKSFRYLDDHQYAIDYITYHESSKSEKRLFNDLLQKGISQEIIKQAFDDWRALGGFQDELEMIKNILKKKHYCSEFDEKDKRKVYAYLLRKGFSVENVNKVFKRLDTFA